MGAVNYATSDYITLGLKPYDISDLEKDLENDKEFSDYLTEIYGNLSEENKIEYLRSQEEDDYANIEAIVSKYDLQYYNVTIEPGYYDGFMLNIKFSGDIYDYISKKEANREITQLKNMLLECAGCGLVQCFPGWCMKYGNYESTLKGIKEAVKEMRAEVHDALTYRQEIAKRRA